MKYWLSYKISWKRFKELNDPCRGDIVPLHGDKMLWELLKDRRINMYLSDLKKDRSDPMHITIKEYPKEGEKIIK